MGELLVNLDISEYEYPHDEIQVKLSTVLEGITEDIGLKGPLDTSNDGHYFLGQAAEAVLKANRPVEEYVREVADDLGLLDDHGDDEQDVNGGLAFERDFALRQAKLAKASLQIVKWSLNENRPLRALDAANSELDRLDEELEGLDALGEARDD